MLEYLFGSKNRERILMYLCIRNEGYARELAIYYNTDLTPVQNQLNKLEIAGVLVSKKVGRTRVFSLNLRYPYIKELKALIIKASEFLPPEDLENLKIYRTRPRRSGKP
jgi:predicted transcriptional regulator